MIDHLRFMIPFTLSKMELFLGFLDDGFDGFYDCLGVFVVEVLGVYHELVFGVFEHEPGLVEGLYAGVSIAWLGFELEAAMVDA